MINLDADRITLGILGGARGGLGKTLVPTYVDDYILVYNQFSDVFQMLKKPASSTPIFGVKSLLFWHDAGVSEFFLPILDYYVKADEIYVSFPFPKGNFIKMTIKATSSTTTEATYVYLRKNGADTAMSITIPAATAGTYVSTTNVSVSAGDLMDLRIDMSQGLENEFVECLMALEFQQS